MGVKKIHEFLEGAMPETLGDRISLFLLKKNISRDVFGKGCGTSGTTTVTGYITGKSKPTADFIELAAKNFDLSPLWLTLGVGPMLLSDASSECQATPEPTAQEASPVDYERECLHLKHLVADKDRALAEVELAKGRQQGLIFEAVVRACREQGLSPNQTRAITFAVMDYEGQLDVGNVADPETDLSHQKAAGE